MEEYGFYDGDMVVIDPSRECESKNYVAYNLIEEPEFINVAQCFKIGTQNKVRYEFRTGTNRIIYEDTEIKIQGTIIGLLRKF